MATMELDPLFVKGLRLLHSKNKDSTEQLKQLLDEVISNSKQSTYSKDRVYTSVKCDDSKIHLKKASRETPELTNYSSKYSSDDNKERKTEKKQAEKAKQVEAMEVEAKIPKLEPPQGYSYYPSSPPDLPKLDQYIPKKDDDTDSSDENTDADDFAMEMGLACVICKSLDVTQGNQLIECQECHNLYHQECHKPPATDDYNDPRRVWYCAKCVKNMKKITTKTQKTTKTGSGISSKEASPQPKATRAEGSPPATILPFKRAELKTSISQGNNNNNQSAANKPIGLAGLAANFGGRPAASSSLTSSTRGGAAKAAASFSAPTAPIAKAPTGASGAGLAKMAAATLPSTSAAPPAAKGLGLLSAAVGRGAGSSSAGASGAGNGGGKVPSCSPLMSADKRLQIMKKKASKMHERRRLSNK